MNRTYVLSSEEFKKFFTLMSHLKNQVSDIIVKNNSIELINDEQNAIIVINGIFDKVDISFVINSVKRNLPLLKLLLSGNPVKIEIDSERKISVWSDGETEINWRYTLDSINKITDDYEENLEKKMFFTIPSKFVEKLEVASKGLREDVLSIDIHAGGAVFYVESKPLQKSVKLLSIKLDGKFAVKETLRFPISPLVTFYSLIKDLGEAGENIAISLLEDTTTKTYNLSMESASENFDGKVYLRSVSSTDLEKEIDEEYEVEEVGEEGEEVRTTIEDI